MSELRIKVRCPSCRALNRVRLVSGKRVRIRCGKCGETLPLSSARALSLAGWEYSKSFLASGLPLGLLALTGAVYKVLGALASPLRALWKAVPERAGKRMAWAALIALGLAYTFIQGTVGLSSLLILLAIMIAVTVLVLAAVRGPQALWQLKQQAESKLFRCCPWCGHRYFRLLKVCPRCGR